jgi:tight adherence protein B
VTHPIAVLAISLALVLLGVAAWLANREAQWEIWARVRDAGERGRGPSTTVVAPAPSIRLAVRNERPLWQRLLRMLGVHPDLPEERTIPWPLVAVLSTVLALAGWWFGFLSFGPILAPTIGLTAGLGTARAVFRWQHRQFYQALLKQLPDALGLVLRAVRSGLPMAEALRSVAGEMPAPTGPQFVRVVSEAAIGSSIDHAILRIYDRTGLTEYGFLSVTLGLQAQSGGNLSETLENLADIVRKRVAIAARARALSAESTASAVILIILPFVCGLAMAIIRPGYLSVFWSDPSGFRMLMIGLVLMSLGTATIRWLIRRATAD